MSKVVRTCIIARPLGTLALRHTLIFALYYWIDLRGKTGAIVDGSDLRFMIEKRLTEAGISIAFPQREIHLSADKPLRVSTDVPGLLESLP